MFKKSYLALILIGVSATAIANTSTTTTTTTSTANTQQSTSSPVNYKTNKAVILPTGIPLLAPSSIGTWSFGIEGLLVQSTSPQFQYAQVVSNTDPNTISNSLVDQNYHGGVAVDGTYHFAGSSRDATIGYTHVEMEDSNSTTILGTESFLDPFDLFPPARFDDVNKLKGQTDENYNAIDMVLGQHFAIGDRVDIRPFGGLRYADLTSRNNSTYYNDPASDPDSDIQATAQINSHYQGLGPRAGVDARVNMCGGLSFVGTFAGSLEVGYDNTDVVLQSGTDTPVSTGLDQNWYIVPELDARLGVDYMHAFTPATSMNVQLGYEVVNYFNAMEDDYADINNVNSTVERQDFGYQGPYLRLQLNLA